MPKPDQVADPALPRVEIPFQHAVYGSFSFKPGGYSLLAASSTLTREQVATFIARCRGWGEPPQSFARLKDPALLIEYLQPRGPWLIIGIWCAGPDDVGRPSALGFHGIFVDDDDLAWIGHDPFRMSEVIRTHWTIDSLCEPSRARIARAWVRPNQLADQGFANRVRELRQGRSVFLDLEVPDVDQIHQIFLALRPRERRRTPVATWVLRPDPRYRLVGRPRLCLDIALTDQEPTHPAGVQDAPSSSGSRNARGRSILAPAAVCLGLAVAVTGLILTRSPRSTREGPLPSITAPISSQLGEEPLPPAEHSEIQPDSALSARVILQVLKPLDLHPEPTRAMEEHAHLRQLLQQIGQRPRYSGPMLSNADRERLARDAGAGSTRALAWDARIQHLRQGRPLPNDFADQPLDRQIQILLWSYRVTAPTRIDPAEAASLLVDTLSFDESLAHNPLEAQFPALTAYRKYLALWPRR